MANIQTLNNLSNRNQNQNRSNRQNNPPPLNSNHQLRGNEELNNQPRSMFNFQRGGITVENIRFAEQHRVLFLSGASRIKNPKDQNYWDMLRETCCPVIKCFSFTTFIIIVDLAMFITSLILGLDVSGDLLEINADTLILLGANQAAAVKSGQVYRLVSAIALHANFLHILGNLVTTLIFVSRIQYTYGFIKTAIFYFVAGIGGNILSILADSQGIKVGASTSLYGILGIIIGYIIINWSGLDLVGPLMTCQLLLSMTIVLVFIIIFTSTSTDIDYYGHLGGFITGLWLSAFHQTLIDEFRQKVVRVVFVCLLISQFLILFLIFYLLN